MKPYLLAFFAALSTFSALFAQVDTIPPVLQCEQNLSITITVFNCWGVYIPVADLIESLSDDQTVANLIELGAREPCVGVGFPEEHDTIIIPTVEYGDHKFEIWARDLAGNISRCYITVSVMDQFGQCDPIIHIATLKPDGTGIANVNIQIVDTDPCSLLSYTSNETTDTFGYKTYFGLIGAYGHEASVLPTKDSLPINGVSGIDLVLISRYLLGLDTLSTYQLLAADANLDGKVTVSDIVLLRKLILGTITEFPHHKSWRFVPTDYVFPNPDNPFLPLPPDRIIVPAAEENVISDFYFVGIKIGDVDMSANPRL